MHWRSRATKEPAASLASMVCERMRERGVVVYPNGEFSICLKIKPPMVFSESDTEQFVETLEIVLEQLLQFS